MEPHTAKATTTSRHGQERAVSSLGRRVPAPTPGAVPTLRVPAVGDKCHKAKRGKGEGMEKSVRGGTPGDNLHRDLESVRHTEI